jgi:hypothetical protein
MCHVSRAEGVGDAYLNVKIEEANETRKRVEGMKKDEAEDSSIREVMHQRRKDCVLTLVARILR